ncbi:MAG: MMPL family transporter [Bacteroidales bacterium]|nr:MMPL family transporter [Bacteroidales bacterium]
MVFVKLYRFFKERKYLLYLLLVLSSALFVFYGLKVSFVEDMTALLPKNKKAESGIVFGNIKVKDKIFIQLTGAAPEVLIACADELMDSVLADTSDIANTLYRIEGDDMLAALDFALEHLPAFVDTSLYTKFDEAVANVGETMRRNREIIMEDETGVMTQMVATDPLNLRSLLLPDMSEGMGFTLVDGHLFSQDSTVAMIFISPSFQSFNSSAGKELIDRILADMDKLAQSYPDVEFLMHGAPVRAAGNSTVMKRDIALTIGISLLIILFILCISFKNVRVVGQTILPVAYGTFFALACMYWIKGGMSLMALGIGTVILGVAVSYCLHVIIHQNFVSNIEQMLLEESRPVILGCITTIGAFLGLLFTKSELLHDFGLFATFTLLGSTFFALFFLPHFLRESENNRDEKIFRHISQLNNYPYDRNKFLIAFLLAVIVVGIAFTHRVQFDNNLKHIGYESDELHKSENLYTQKHDAGHLQRYYAVVSPDLDVALDANDRLSRKLDSLKGTGDVMKFVPTVSLLFRSENVQEERISAWKAYWTEEKVSEAVRAVKEAAVREQLPPDVFDPFEAMVSADYQPGNLYESGAIPDGLLCNFIEKSDGKYLIFNSVQMNEDKKASVDDYVANLPHAVVVDPFYYTGNIITMIRDDFSTTLLISSIFVFVVLLLSFRNVIIAIIAFMPMFLSWYVVQGWMAIFGLPFNLINIVISTFIFGIGVDYSIFVMQGLMSEHGDDGGNLLEYHKVAVFFSALILVVVVLSMLFATHPALKSIGVCTLIGMVSTVMITYTLQPLLFRLYMNFKSRKIQK